MLLNLQTTVCLWCLYDSHFAWLSVHVCLCGMCAENSKTTVLGSFINSYLGNATELTQILIALYSKALREYFYVAHLLV